MRPSIIIAFLFICSFSNSTFGQWYNDEYGVENINDLTNEQLMASYSDAKQNSLIGGIFTGTGAVIMLSGMAKATKNAAEDLMVIVGSFGMVSPPPHESGGGGLFLTGAVIVIGGAIIWRSGGSIKKQIRPIIKSRGLLSTISVYPGTGYELITDSYFPSLTMRIDF